MHHRNRLMTLILALASLPAVAAAASQPQVPTPTGHLGGRVSADETPSVMVMATDAVTPSATPSTPDIPGPADCAVAPREGDVAELTGPPAAGIASREETLERVPSRTLAELPAGEPADEATVRDVTATVRRLVACANSDDGRAYEALHTDDYFRRAATVDVERKEPAGVLDWLFGVSEIRSVSYGFVSFPPGTPMPEIVDVRVLPDGRVGAVVSGPHFSPIFFAFAREEPDGPLLVDEAILIGDDMATPRAST